MVAAPVAEAEAARRAVVVVLLGAKTDDVEDGQAVASSVVGVGIME